MKIKLLVENAIDWQIIENATDWQIIEIETDNFADFCKKVGEFKQNYGGVGDGVMFRKANITLLHPDEPFRPTMGRDWKPTDGYGWIVKNPTSEELSYEAAWEEVQKLYGK